MSGTSSQKYTGVAIALHWAIGLAVMFMLWYGHYVHDLPRDTIERAEGFNTHYSIGITILILMLVRIVWRMKNPAPEMLPGLKPMEKVALKSVHHGFYFLLILMPILGWAAMSTSSRDIPLDLFQTVPFFKLDFLKAMGDRQTLHEFFEDAHGYLSWVILATLALHIVGVLKHVFVMKDKTWERMRPW